MSVQMVIVFGAAIPLRYIKNNQVLSQLRTSLQKLINDQYEKQWLLYLDQYTRHNPILKSDQMFLIKKDFESKTIKITLPQDDQELFSLKLQQFYPFRRALTDFTYELCRLFGEINHQPIEDHDTRSSNWSSLLVDNNDEELSLSEFNDNFNYTILADQTTTETFGIYPCLLEKETIGDCCLLVCTGTSSFCKQHYAFQGDKEPTIYEMNLPVITKHLDRFLENFQIDSAFRPWPKLFAIDVVG